MPRVSMERSGEMEVFARVVREGGFSAAARTLDLTPSAVSKLIQRLETRLGTRLLARTTRALSLTEEGEAYHRAALGVLQALNEADQAVSAGALRGRVRVNASVPVGTLFVLPSLPAFLARYPEIGVELSVTDVVIDLLEQKADLAIRVGPLPDSALVARRLAQSRRVVCASPDYLKRRGTPATPQDLQQHNCLTFTFRRSRNGWPFRVKGEDQELIVRGNLQLNNGQTMLQATLAGLGVARFGAFLAAPAIKTGALVPLLEKFNPGDLEPIHAIYLGGGPVPARVRVFIDHLAQVMARAPGFVRG